MRSNPVFICALMLLVAAPASQARLVTMDREEMLTAADVIAVVNILDLISADQERAVADLNARAEVHMSLKGEVQGVIAFRIRRAFEARFDVSTGRTLVFLRRGVDGRYETINWSRSCIYVGGAAATWFEEDGKWGATVPPERVFEDVKRRTR